jgi:DNA invertase Pin-like site-specific DNA recombinase
MARYGYARCSTADGQQDIQRQERELIARGADEIFAEYESGTKKERHKFAKLCDKLYPGDVLISTEVSRLSRSLHQLLHILEDAKERQIRLECGALVLDYATGKVDPMAVAMYQMSGVFAELERGVTVERIKSGLVNAKAKGAVIGRPKKTMAEVPDNVKELLPRYLAGEFGKSDYARRAGIARPTLYKYLRLMGVTKKPANVPNKPVMTVESIPDNIKSLYAEYKAGKFGVSEFARRASVSRDTIYRWIGILKHG